MPHPQRTSNSTPPDPPKGDEPPSDSGERLATFGEVLHNREYRAILGSSLLSWLGDHLAKAAVMVLVFQATESVFATAATFAISYAPWFLIGPMLSALAERYPYRTTMIVSDLARMVLIAMVALPGLPVPILMALLFLTSLGNPPYDSSKSALIPSILKGDRLVVGLSLSMSAGQAAQVIGYLVGGVIAVHNPRAALLIDAGTFAVSAALIYLFVQRRPAVASTEGRRHLVRETLDGFNMVFRTPALRGIAVLVFASMLVAIVPEGLAVPWAQELQPDAAKGERGLAVGLIMLAAPLGYILGALTVGRLVRPDLRVRLIRPFAVVAPVFMIPAVLNPPLQILFIMTLACGFCLAGMLPASNALFVKALPNAYRARAFGVMQSGVQLLQGAAVLATGTIAEFGHLPTVVGLWSLAAFLVVLFAAAAWPARERFNAAIERARLLNEAPAAG